jgi:hypothetical protein
MFASLLFMTRRPMQEDSAGNKFRKGDSCISNSLRQSEITRGNLTCCDHKEPRCSGLEGGAARPSGVSSLLW